MTERTQTPSAPVGTPAADFAFGPAAGSPVSPVVSPDMSVFTRIAPATQTLSTPPGLGFPLAQTHAFSSSLPWTPQTTFTFGSAQVQSATTTFGGFGSSAPNGAMFVARASTPPAASTPLFGTALSPAAATVNPFATCSSSPQAPTVSAPQQAPSTAAVAPYMPPFRRASPQPREPTATGTVGRTFAHALRAGTNGKASEDMPAAAPSPAKPPRQPPVKSAAVVQGNILKDVGKGSFAGWMKKKADTPGNAEFDSDEAKARRAQRFGASRMEARSPEVNAPASPARADSEDGEDDVGRGTGKQDLERAAALRGTCLDMCPAAERERRERLEDLHPFERVSGTTDRTSAAIAVKKFTRTVDDPKPSDVRPPPVLRHTMEHLLGLMDLPGQDFDDVHKFLWDRMRSIRQDFTLQSIFDETSIDLHEQMVRFMILSEHELCENVATLANPEGFNSHLNTEQLNKCLISLHHMYEDHAHEGHIISSEPEFQAYHILLQLDAHGRYKADTSQVMLGWMKMRPEVLNSPAVRFALDVYRTYRSGNYVGFFRLAQQAPYLPACLMHIFANKMRSHALQVVNSTGPKGSTYPLSDLAEMLAASEAEVQDLAEHHGLTIVTEKQGRALAVKESTFIEPQADFPVRRSAMVEQKSAGTKRLDTLTAPVWPGASNTLQPAPRTLLRPSPANKVHVLPSTQLPAAQEQRLTVVQPPAGILPVPEPGREVQRVQVLEHDAQEAAADCLALARAEAVEAGHKRMAERAAAETAAALRNEAHQRAAAAAAAAEAQAAAIAKSQAMAKAAQEAAAVAQAARRQQEKEKRHKAELKRKALEAAKQARRARKQQLAVVLLRFRLWRYHVAERVFARNREERILQSLRACAPSPGLQLAVGCREPSRVRQPSARRTRNIIGLGSWEPLDIPIVALDHLQQRNPHARVLTWKVIVCSGAQDRSSQFDTGETAVAAQWLRAKLKRGSSQEQQVLSVYRVRSRDSTTSELLFCARDVSAEEMDSAQVAGAGGVAFLVAGSSDDGLKADGKRLRRLVDGLPPRTQIPLLLLLPAATAIGQDANYQARLRDGLALHHLEQYVNAVNIVRIGADPTKLGEWAPAQQHDTLASGIEWLAMHAPRQLDVRVMPLATALEEATAPLVKMVSSEDHIYTPASIIDAFNKEVSSVAKQVKAAHLLVSSSAWPPPEFITALGFDGDRLPANSWQQSARLPELLSLVDSLKLPTNTAEQTWMQYLDNALGYVPNSSTQASSWSLLFVDLIYRRLSLVDSEPQLLVFLPCPEQPPTAFAVIPYLSPFKAEVSQDEAMVVTTHQADEPARAEPVMKRKFSDLEDALRAQSQQLASRRARTTPETLFFNRKRTASTVVGLLERSAQFNMHNLQSAVAQENEQWSRLERWLTDALDADQPRPVTEVAHDAVTMPAQLTAKGLVTAADDILTVINEQMRSEGELFRQVQQAMMVSPA